MKIIRLDEPPPAQIMTPPKVTVDVISMLPAEINRPSEPQGSWRITLTDGGHPYKPNRVIEVNTGKKHFYVWTKVIGDGISRCVSFSKHCENKVLTAEGSPSWSHTNTHTRTRTTTSQRYCTKHCFMFQHELHNETHECMMFRT